MEKKIKCPRCKSKKYSIDYKDRYGEQYYRCKRCRKKYSELTINPFRQDTYRLLNYAYSQPEILFALRLKTCYNMPTLQVAMALYDRKILHTRWSDLHTLRNNIYEWEKKLLKSGNLKLFENEKEMESFFFKPNKWRIEKIIYKKESIKKYDSEKGYVVEKPTERHFYGLVNDKFGSKPRYIVDVSRHSTVQEAEKYFDGVIRENKISTKDSMPDLKLLKERLGKWYDKPRFIESRSQSKEAILKKLVKCMRSKNAWQWNESIKPFLNNYWDEPEMPRIDNIKVFKISELREYYLKEKDPCRKEKWYILLLLRKGASRRDISDIVGVPINRIPIIKR